MRPIDRSGAPTAGSAPSEAVSFKPTRARRETAAPNLRYAGQQSRRTICVRLCDGYHFPIVHKSWMSSVDEETSEMLSFMTDEKAVTHALGNGHSVMVMVPGHVDLDQDDGTEPLQERFAHVTEALSKEMPPEQVRRIVRSLHGAGFTLVLITSQIYLEQRIDPTWRARAQSLHALMSGGVGNLLGYLGTGWWFDLCTRDDKTSWPIFWLGLAAAVTAVLIYFFAAYHGRGTPPEKPAS